MSKSPPTKYKLITLLLLVAAFFAATTILYSFSQMIKENQAQIGRDRLREVTLQNVDFVQLVVNEKITFIESITNELKQAPNLKSPKVTDQLQKISTGTDFERLAIDFLNGESYTSDGHVVDISNMGYLDEIQKGKTFITELTIAKVDNEPCISIICPILKDGIPIAAIRGTIYTQNFGKILNTDFFEGEGYFHLLNSKGEYLAHPQNDNAFLMDENYFEAIKKLTYDKGYSANQIKSDIATGAEGVTAYSYQGKERYVEYMPVGINDWYLMIIVPKWIINQNAKLIQKEVFYVMLALSAIALAVFLFILYAMKRSGNEIKKINDQLSVEEKRYRFMLERTDNIIFEYTLQEGTIEYSEKFTEVFGYKPTTTGLPYSIIQSEGIHPEDQKSLMSLFEDVNNGKPNSATQLRIRTNSGGYTWCSIVVATIFDENHLPIKALGVIENVDTQKQREIDLIAKAERDQLTNLYNKVTTEQLIQSYLSNPDNQTHCYALLIIDVDHFKAINDRLGHLYGDLVLTNLANGLKPVRGDETIVGRIGGDEFFVFMKIGTEEAIVIQKAKKICELFYKTYAKDEISCTISASIGIALFPQHGQDFETLYKNADAALYATKAAGKNGYSFYDGPTTVGYTSLHPEIIRWV